MSDVHDKNEFTLAVKCHWCGHRGLRVWDKTDGRREAVSIERFYERVTKKLPFQMETICNACGGTQPV